MGPFLSEVLISLLVGINSTGDERNLLQLIDLLATNRAEKVSSPLITNISIA